MKGFKMAMATKMCPFCAEEIQQEAVKCKHCGSWLNQPNGSPGAGSPPVDPQPIVGMSPVGTGRLTRSTTDKMLSGVCGGLGKYLGMDPTLVRVLFALSTFFTFGAPGVIAYVILACVVPTDDQVPSY